MQCINGHENPQSARFCGTCGQGMMANAGGGTAFGAGGSIGPSGFQSQGVTLRSLQTSLVDNLKTHRHSGHLIDFQSVLAMISGALFAVAFALIALNAVAESESESPYSVGFFWAALGCVGVYLAGRFVGAGIIAGATTAFVSLAAVALLFLFGPAIEDGNIGLSLVLLGIVYVAAWALPILRGRPALLAASLVSFSSGLVIVILQSSISNAVDCSDSSYSDCFDDPTELLTSIAQKSSTLFLIVGIVLLAIAWTLDRKDWPMLGRVFIGVGIFFEVNGAFGVLQSSGDRTAASILLAIAGALLVLVAIQQSRKTSLVIGAIGALAGIIAFIAAITESNEGVAGFIILTLIASVGIGFLCIKQSARIQQTLLAVGKP
jgi:hypothetical protein